VRRLLPVSPGLAACILALPGACGEPPEHARQEPLQEGAGPARFVAPPRPELGPLTMEISASTLTLLNGPGPEDDQRLPAGPYPLVSALRRATPGSHPVIGVRGPIPGVGVTIGGGDNDAKAYVVHWGATPMEFAVVGLTPDASLREFAIRDRMNDGSVNGGVADARFEGLTLEARYRSCVSTPKGQRFGLLRFYDCRFVPGHESLAEGAYEGYGYKWGLRSQARGRYDLRQCSFAPVLEHSIYVDSPDGDCIFQGLRHGGSTRTAIQVVNRAFDNPGPSGTGTLLFEDIDLYDIAGDGGAGLTVAGHDGELIFRDIRAREDPERGRYQGVIAVWTDASPEHGAQLFHGADGGLYSTRGVTVESLDVDTPHADRAHVALSGVEHIRIEDFRIRGNRVAFHLDAPEGVARIRGPARVDGERVLLEDRSIVNGRVDFATPGPLSRFPGFQSAAKIRLGRQDLSDAEIDRRWPRER